jgi:putative transposase
MPRPPRLDLPGIPQHVVQRAVDRRPCFVLEVHYREYLRHLLEQGAKYGCHVHAYALMVNHVHLLATPMEPGGIGRLMQAVGRNYVGFFNLLMERTGTLWEGRFKSCLVDSGAYVLNCYRYIELNPVRAGIVQDPGDFRWSSFRCNGTGQADPVITPHSVYMALGLSAEERTRAYREFVAQGCNGREVDEIRLMTSHQRAFGGADFRRDLAARFGRPMGFVKRGRPAKTVEDE